MTQQIHEIRINNTRTPLKVVLRQPDAVGTKPDPPIDLTGLTVKFRMWNTADDVEKVAESETNVTNGTSSDWITEYAWQVADIDTAGIFRAVFNVYSGTAYDSVPVHTEGLLIYIHGNNQTAQEAHAAAVLAAA